MKSNNGNIYLSGGMEKAVDLGSAWRIDCSKNLTQLGFFPIDITALDKSYTAKHGKVITGIDPLQDKANIRHQFIYTDLTLIIEDADAVVAYYDESFKNGAGSFAECQCAYDNGKPLFIMSAFPLEKMPSWLKALSTKIFTDWNALYDYMALLPQGTLTGNAKHAVCNMCGETSGNMKWHLYCERCTDVMSKTYQEYADRYDFICDELGFI